MEIFEVGFGELKGFVDRLKVRDGEGGIKRKFLGGW